MIVCMSVNVEEIGRSLSLKCTGMRAKTEVHKKRLSQHVQAVKNGKELKCIITNVGRKKQGTNEKIMIQGCKDIIVRISVNVKKLKG